MFSWSTRIQQQRLLGPKDLDGYMDWTVYAWHMSDPRPNWSCMGAGSSTWAGSWLLTLLSVTYSLYLQSYRAVNLHCLAIHV